MIRRLIVPIIVVALIAAACSDDSAADPLQATAVLPTSGLPQGGYLVEIAGVGFTGDEVVTFGALPATVVDAEPGLLLVMAPVAEVGDSEPRTVDVVVASGGYVTVLEGAFTFTPEVAPMLPLLASIDPAAAANEGGVEVAITGEGFGDDPRVFFGTAGLVEAEVVAVTPTRIDVVVPQAPDPDRNALVTVAVRHAATGHEGRLFGAFQYGAPAALVTEVNVSPTTPGAMVIGGFGFTEPATVTLAGLEAAVLDVEPTSITVLVPSPEITDCESITGPVVVEMVDARLIGPDPFTFGTSVPFVTAYETQDVGVDSEGRVVADTPIVVEGTGFVGDTVIRLAGFEFAAEPDEQPPAESSATAVIPAGTGLGGAPGDTLSGVLVNGQGCEVALPLLVRLVGG